MISNREKAIKVLHDTQSKIRERCGFGAQVNANEMLERTLQLATTRENTSVRRNGKIYDRLYGYNETLELIRWSRTRDIIQRVIPGVDENPIYLEMIARQAASIEIVLRNEYLQSANPRNTELCNHVLIGTIPTLGPSAYTNRTGDYFYIFVSVGLINFLYQVTKAVVFSWKPVPPDKNASVGFDNKPEIVSQVLVDNPLLITYFTQILSGYLFRGEPKVFGYSPPSIEFQYPLQLLTNFNERFVLAHEYAHDLFNFLDYTSLDFIGSKEEISADIVAFKFLIQSGAILDGFPPNVSLQCAFLVLTALQVLREALDIIRHGKIHEDQGFIGQPSLAKRMESLQNFYQKEIDDGQVINAITPLLRPAQTLSILWQEAQPYFYRAREDSQQLHAIWAKA